MLKQTAVRFLGLACLAFSLSACQLVPSDGPLLKSVTSEKESNDNFVYGLVKLNSKSVSSLSKHDYFPLQEAFGVRRSTGGSLLGKGDVLDIVIFEAGPDGLFSTAEKKSVNIKVTVQENGRISIPFDGTVQAAGKTLEQTRRSIVNSLKGRAVEPDVIVNLATNNSRTVVVNGSVNSAKIVPLITGREKILDVVGAAGGTNTEPFDTYISLSRRGITRRVAVQTLIDKPQENIPVRAGDSIFLTHDPRTFLAFGAVEKAGRHRFETRSLDLMQAASIAGGLDPARADPRAYFVFRYEYPHVLRHLGERGQLDPEVARKMVENSDARDKEGRFPVIYQVDLSDADNFFIAKRFPVRANDMIYVARSPGVDFARIVSLFNSGVSTVRLGSSL